jgi:hypothetical protein
MQAAAATLAAVVVVLVIRAPAHRGGERSATLPRLRAKGGEIAFSLVGDFGERIEGSEGSYRDGDRFKAIVTCPPSMKATFYLVVLDSSGVSYPIEPVSGVACGNNVPLLGAFRLTGEATETVCLFWSEGEPMSRSDAATIEETLSNNALCKQLRPASTGP